LKIDPMYREARHDNETSMGTRNPTRRDKNRIQFHLDAKRNQVVIKRTARGLTKAKMSKQKARQIENSLEIIDREQECHGAEE
jgi:hypothetical protein